MRRMTMTKQEYDGYVSRVEKFMRDRNLFHLSGDGEEYFSWRPCPVCKCTDGGTREDCTSFDHVTKEVVEIGGVCQDCVYFAAYGQLDDMTMLSIEEEN
jgi:hypothetical protein